MNRILKEIAAGLQLPEILETISRNRSRSLLTGFGIFWGVFMLILLIGQHAAEHADVAEDGRGDDALGDDELQDVVRFGSDGLPHPELACALLHGDEHDVRYAHDTAEQGEQSHHP